jgi:hypothetical protein
VTQPDDWSQIAVPLMTAQAAGIPDEALIDRHSAGAIAVLLGDVGQVGQRSGLQPGWARNSAIATT